MTQSKAIQYFGKDLFWIKLPMQIEGIGYRMRVNSYRKLYDLSERLDDKFRHLQLITDMQIDRNKLECTGMIRIK